MNYNPIAIREAALAHAKDINTKNSAGAGYNAVSYNPAKDVLSDAQDIYEFLTQDGPAVEETSGKPDPTEAVVIPFPATQGFAVHMPTDDEVATQSTLTQEHENGWNDAIDAVLDLQKKHRLELSDSVSVRAARQAVVALRKGDHRG